MLPTSIQTWVDTFQAPFHLRAVEHSPHELTVRELLSRHPALVGSEIEALLWLRIGLIDRAHALVQDASQGAPAYIHGMIHRMEGDYWNANYWFGRCHDLSNSLPISPLATDARHGTTEPFSAKAFTQQVERFLGRHPSENNRDDREAARLAQMALAEWTAVWGHLEQELLN